MGENVIWLILILLMFGGGVGSFIRNQLERRRNDRLQREKGPEPICGCGDHFAYHDPKTGHCHAQHRQPNVWNEWGNPIGWAPVQCECRQYVGPEPLTTYYAPPLSSGTHQAIPPQREDQHDKRDD